MAATPPPSFPMMNKKMASTFFYAPIQETLSPKRMKLQGRATSHFKALEKFFPTVIRFLIFLDVIVERFQLLVS